METRFVTCGGCSGLGEWDEGPINTGSDLAPVDPEYRQVKCHECGGVGKVEVEVESITLDDLTA